jgi:CheY-like chemotaxis protein
MPEELARCKEAGMLDRIVKPIVVDDLVRTIRQHIAVVEGRVVASPR